MLTCLLINLNNWSAGQSPNRGDVVPTKVGTNSRASRGDPILQREERPASVVVKEVIKTVKVAPTDGALVMWLTLGAKVEVTPMSG